MKKKKMSVKRFSGPPDGMKIESRIEFHEKSEKSRSDDALN